MDDTPSPATRSTHFEDGNGYVRVRGESLEQVYPSSSRVQAWTRDVVYLRPSSFVVYDRTAVSATTGDQHLSWHLIFTPASVAAPPGCKRYDVTNPTAGFLGAVTTVLPQGAATTLVNVFNSGKVFRLEVRPSAPAPGRWLTVIEPAAQASAVASASALTTSPNAAGTLLQAAAGNGAVVFGAGAASTPISGAVTFSVPAAQTRIVAVDLAPSTAYSAAVTTSGGFHAVTIQPGAGFTTTANGTLYVAVSAAGAVSAGP